MQRLKKNVKKLTPGIIEKELIKRDYISVLIKDKGFVNWNYETLLPVRIETYERVIEPKKPITGLNGSYIIAAYQCKDREAAMIFFYNVYRDEYYGEMRSKEFLSLCINMIHKPLMSCLKHLNPIWKKIYKIYMSVLNPVKSIFFRGFIHLRIIRNL